MKHNISFVIPCYNSARTIGNVVKEIQSTVRKNDSYEIILVNDGSKDDTFEVISSLAEKNSTNWLKNWTAAVMSSMPDIRPSTIRPIAIWEAD